LKKREINSLELHQKNTIHLLYRACFGPSYNDIEYFLSLPTEEVNDIIFKQSEQFKPLETVSEDLLTFMPNAVYKSKKRRKTARKLIRHYKMKLNYDWLMLMINSEAQLRERMAFFWHDHFATNVRNPTMHQKQINTIRKHSLGYFGDLVIEMSKDPAMINYLNIRQNIKGNPNENFGRELLELFTIGIGHYSEKDIKEASEAFTGYNYNMYGDFFIEASDRDNSKKQFMGLEDYFTGDDIINLIFQNPKTGEHIIQKIYYYLAGEQINEKLLAEYSKAFYKSGYHIGTLVKQILTSDNFYNTKGQQIKSPVELLVNVARISQMEFQDPMLVYGLQQKLSQTLFEPPNVSGWVNGKAWLDFNSIIERMMLPKTLFEEKPVRVKNKKVVSLEGFELEFDKNISSKAVTIDFKPIIEMIDRMGIKNPGQFFGYLLYNAEHKHLKGFYNTFNKNLRNQQAKFKLFFQRAMMLPEYQLC